MKPLNEIRSLMDFNTAVQIRMAFAARREALLASWKESLTMGNGANAEYWAQSIQDANDAQVALGLEAL